MSCTEDPERNVCRPQPLNLPGGTNTLAVPIHQQPQQHSWVIPGRARPAPATGPIELGRVEHLDCESPNNLSWRPTPMGAA